MRTLSVILLLALACISADAQLTRDRSKECVICHLTWGQNYETLRPVLKPVDHPIQIDGQAARVSDERMCWSCHDGYVSDSRASFLEDDFHMKDMEATQAVKDSGLPLDVNGKVYCGTCHTPHASKMERQISYSPFMRTDQVKSGLCVLCHAGQADPARDHPIHVELTMPLSPELAGHTVSTNTVECLTCHQLHNDQPLKLTQGSDRTRLCKSCHEEQFELEWTDHDLRQEHGSLVVDDKGTRMAATDVCAACHVTHGATGEGLWSRDLPAGRGVTPIVKGEDARCLSCHNDLGPAREKSWKGHGHSMDKPVTAGTVADLPLDEDGGMSCLTCHNPHRWSLVETDLPGPGNEEGNALNSFLRLPDDRNSRLCSSCHRDQAEALVSDHNSAFWEDKPAGQCNSCHATHDEADFTDGHAHKELSPFSSLCMSCHEGEGLHGATSLGEHGHPLLVEQLPGQGLPAIRKGTLKTVQPGAEQAGQALLVGCESCHDPHRWNPGGVSWSGTGAEGDETNSFLLMDNSDAGLCRTCHTNEAAVMQSGHNLTLENTNRSACSFCHTTHGAVSDWAIVSSSLDDQAMDSLTTRHWSGGEALETVAANWSPGARHCLSCHHDMGQSSVWPKAWGHPQDVQTLSTAWRSDSLSMPLFNDSGRTEGPLGRVDCTSCHDPHVAHQPWEFEHTTDFLRQRSHETFCADCHGDKALWKYRYYHHVDKRMGP